MLLHEIVNFAGEGIRPKAKIVGFDVVFLAELIAAFDQTPVGGAVSNDSDFGVTGGNFGPRYEGTCGLKFPVEPLHVALEVVGPLAVLRFFVVSASTGKVGGGGMVGAR